jgi:hypothetical protein
MTAVSPAVSAAQTGHPITRAATLPTSVVNTVLLVCAGGASVSVQAAPSWLTNGVKGETNGTAVAADMTSVETGKGSPGLLASVEQWAASVHGSSRNSRSDSASQQQQPWGRVFPPSTSSCVLPAEQRASLQAGEVTCLCVAALPGTDTAIAVVGSTVGTIALFLIEGSRTLWKVAECSLVKWSRGCITAQDAVVDVAFSMDPAGRPEFVSAASATCVVVVDVQLLYRGDREEEEVSGSDGDDVAESCGDAWSRSTLRAKAVEALERPHAQLVRRSRSDVFACAFAEAHVVRVLAPQRLHAAVAMDVALLVVLSDGTLHYIERVVEGGSVRLLAEHHRLRFAKGSAFIAYAQDSMLDMPASSRGGPSSTSSSSLPAGAETDSRALPHVVYRYRLSPQHMNVCQASARGSDSDASFSTSSSSPAGGITVVNDAALYFNERDAVCHVVVAGTQLVPAHKAAGRLSSLYGVQGSGVGSLVDAVAGAAAGWTLGRIQQEKGTGAAAGHRALGWWAVVHNAVLPRFTFDRVTLERQAFQQAQRNLQQQQPRDRTGLTSSSSSLLLRHTGEYKAGDFAAAYCTDAASPFMMHVQSSVMALPAASLSTAAALASSTGRHVAATAAAAAGLEGSGLYEARPTSPVASSPTGTGAHVAASNTTAGVGNGFAAAAMVAGLLVLSAGADVYVGDLREVPAMATSLPMLRPVCSCGAVVESISLGLSRDARSVLVASGSRVAPVSL